MPSSGYGPPAMTVPSFESYGLLPPCVHDATEDEVARLSADEEPERDQPFEPGVTQRVNNSTLPEISGDAKAAVDTILDAEIRKRQG